MVLCARLFGQLVALFNKTQFYHLVETHSYPLHLLVSPKMLFSKQMRQKNGFAIENPCAMKERHPLSRTYWQRERNLVASRLDWSEGTLDERFLEPILYLCEGRINSLPLDA